MQLYCNGKLAELINIIVLVQFHENIILIKNWKGWKSAAFFFNTFIANFQQIKMPSLSTLLSEIMQSLKDQFFFSKLFYVNLTKEEFSNTAVLNVVLTQKSVIQEVVMEMVSTFRLMIKEYLNNTW